MQKEKSSLAVDNGNSLNLLASRSKASGKNVFPQVPVHSPVADRYSDVALDRTAVLYSYTVIHPSPKAGLPPFALAYADFQPETRVFGRLECSLDEIRIGMKVEAVVADAPGGFVLVRAKEL